MEKNLIINKRGESNDEFKAILSYDSTNYGLGVKFAGFQIFLNNDTTPFVELIIDKKQKIVAIKLILIIIIRLSFWSDKYPIGN